MNGTITPTAEKRHQALADLLVCPTCKGELLIGADDVRCTACGLQLKQALGRCLNLLPDRLWEAGDDSGWCDRQQEMEEWYRRLIVDPTAARDMVAHDYEPYAPFLATFSGNVLDLGGGAGFTRTFLAPEVRYVVADPSLDWLGAEWQQLFDGDAILDAASCFVRAVGEHLPFRTGSFDGVLALWALNHLSEPEVVFREVHRVLKPGGRFLAVLEDMEPSWWDLVCRMLNRRLGIGGSVVAGSARAAWAGRKVLEQKLRNRRLGQEWPLQSDHLRIRDSDMRHWSAGRFKVVQRAWVGEYLTYHFERAKQISKYW